MEATQKQIKYIKVLAKRVGNPIKDEDMPSYDKEEASKIIDDLLGQLVKQNGDAKKETKVVDSDFNGQRFGLACKLVAQHYTSVQFKFWILDSYISDVHEAYKALEQAENTYGRSQ